MPNYRLTALLLCCHLISHAAERTWTDTQGRSLQAEYLRSDAATVTLRIKGQEHTLPITRFSAADQAWITAQAAGAAPAATIPPMTQRQIAEYLLKLRADGRPMINVMAGEKLVRAMSPQELPAEDFYVLGIFDSSPAFQPFPWALLQQMPKLMDLSVATTGPITAADIAHLSTLVAPFSIQILAETTLDSAAVAAFPRLPTLKFLRFSANLIAEKDLPVLASRLSKIETLTIMPPGAANGAVNQPQLITDTALAAALPAWDALKHLTLRGIPFTDKTAAAITSGKKLEELTLDKMDSLAASALTPLAKHRGLQKLHLKSIPRLTAADIQSIQQALKNCQVDQQN